MLEQDTVITALRGFVAKNLLDGEDVDLDEDTPLLEYGLIDSMSIVKLATFIKETYRVPVDPTDYTPANFESIGVMSAWILERANRG